MFPLIPNKNGLKDEGGENSKFVKLYIFQVFIYFNSGEESERETEVSPA